MAFLNVMFEKNLAYPLSLVSIITVRVVYHKPNRANVFRPYEFLSLTED